MKRTYKIILVLTMLLSISFTNVGKKDDVTPPVITTDSYLVPQEVAVNWTQEDIIEHMCNHNQIENCD